MAAQHIIRLELSYIQEFLKNHPNGASIHQMSQVLQLNRRTLQRRLLKLKHSNLIKTSGKLKTMRYYPLREDLKPTPEVLEEEIESALQKVVLKITKTTHTPQDAALELAKAANQFPKLYHLPFIQRASKLLQDHKKTKTPNQTNSRSKTPRPTHDNSFNI